MCDYTERKCEKCEGTGKVDGNPAWHHGNYWKDTKAWCNECEGEGSIVEYEDEDD